MLFPGGIESTSNATLIFSAVAAAIYALIIGMRVTPLRTAVKALAVGLLAVLSIVENGPLLLIGALLLSACGDALLSREGDDRLQVAGLFCFIAAHLVYTTLFITHGAGLAVLESDLWRAGVAAAAAIVALVMLVLAWRRVKPALRLPLLLYTLAVVAMTASALTMDDYRLMAGALLFIASDAALATERFLISAISPHRGWLRLAAWSLYYVAQATLTLGVLLG